MLEIGREAVYGEAADENSGGGGSDADRGGDGVTLAANGLSRASDAFMLGRLALVPDLSGRALAP